MVHRRVHFPLDVAHSSKNLLQVILNYEDFILAFLFVILDSVLAFLFVILDSALAFLIVAKTSSRIPLEIWTKCLFLPSYMVSSACLTAYQRATMSLIPRC